MATDDAYAALGLDPRCTDSQIVVMYRHLAKLHHPDRGGDAKRFREIQDAYDAIGSSERRASYDRGREQARRFTVRDDVREPGVRSEDERYDAAYQRVHPDWERDLRDWLNQREQRTARTRGEDDGEVGARTRRTTSEPQRNRRSVQRRAAAAIAAGVIASTLRWVQIGEKGVASRDDVAASILATGLGDRWTWFAIITACGIEAWAEILRPGAKHRAVRTGVLAAIAATALAGAGANLLVWQVGAWALVAGAFVAMKSVWGRNRIKNRTAGAR